MRGETPLHKAFKAVLASLADGAEGGRLAPCAKVSADLTTPDRVGERRGARFLLPFLERVALLLWGPSLGDGAALSLTLGDSFVDVEGAVACPELLEILVPVVARTDDVPVLIGFS